MCQPVAVPNAKWPQVLLCGRDTGCQAHSWCDAPDLALPRYTSLPCNCSELREGGEWHSGFLTRAVSILCMGTKALWNGMREKQSGKQHCTRLLRNAVKNFQNEKFPTRSMPRSPCVRRGREAWTPEMWTREKGNLATAPWPDPRSAACWQTHTPGGSMHQPRPEPSSFRLYSMPD